MRGKPEPVRKNPSLRSLILRFQAERQAILLQQVLQLAPLQATCYTEHPVERHADWYANWWYAKRRAEPFTKQRAERDVKHRTKQPSK